MPEDVVIVGAGAAGIAAARDLAARGYRPLLLEARNRAGGRAWTDTATFGFPIDMGCSWLHSADVNPWTDYARDHGFELLTQLPDWGRRVGREQRTASESEAWMHVRERNDRLIREAAEQGVDVAVAGIVPDDRFKPMFDAIMGWIMGVYSERVSSLDLASYVDTEIDWTVREGLGSLVAHGAATLDVRLNTPVRQIDSRREDVRVTTDRGAMEARAVIVTVPTNVLAAGGIRFLPALPATFEDALAAVPLGVANKVFFQMAPGALPFDGTTHFLGGDATRVGSYQVRPLGREVLLAYFGGDLALELERHGKLEQFARDELSRIFGSDFVRRIVHSVSSAWATDPWSLGSYSAAAPGNAHMRRVLSEPVHERVFYAGEACSIEYFGAIHGAWHSGVAAAERACALLQQPG